MTVQGTELVDVLISGIENDEGPPQRFVFPPREFRNLTTRSRAA